MNETTKWAMGTLVAAMLSWSTWITAAVWEDRARLARIETKIDIIVDRMIPVIVHGK